MRSDSDGREDRGIVEGDHESAVTTAEPGLVEVVRVPKQIVVLGAGVWVSLSYFKPLQEYGEAGECRVFFIYVGGPDRPPPAIPEPTETTEWYSLLDASRPHDREGIAKLRPDAVFVVTPDYTHCDEAHQWIDRAELVIVEKPFDVDPDKIMWLRERDRAHQKVWGFDHYLVRANQFHVVQDSLRVGEHLSGGLKRFHFEMLEAGDAHLEDRKHSIQRGMIHDMASHAAALILPFGDPRTIRVDQVKAGVYTPSSAAGVESDGREIFYEGRESFAEVSFTFTAYEAFGGGTVESRVRVGKAVGSRPIKKLALANGEPGSHQVILDLLHGYVDYVAGDERRPVTSLFPDPVRLLVREVVEAREGTKLDTLALFPPETGQDIVDVLVRWSRPIEKHLAEGKGLQTYTAGASADEICAELAPLWLPSPAELPELEQTL